jgi:hypothetical protein
MVELKLTQELAGIPDTQLIHRTHHLQGVLILVNEDLKNMAGPSPSSVFLEANFSILRFEAFKQKRVQVVGSRRDLRLRALSSALATMRIGWSGHLGAMSGRRTKEFKGAGGTLYRRHMGPSGILSRILPFKPGHQRCHRVKLPQG